MGAHQEQTTTTTTATTNTNTINTNINTNTLPPTRTQVHAGPRGRLLAPDSAQSERWAVGDWELFGGGSSAPLSHGLFEYAVLRLLGLASEESVEGFASLCFAIFARIAECVAPPSPPPHAHPYPYHLAPHAQPWSGQSRSVRRWPFWLFTVRV